MKFSLARIGWNFPSNNNGQIFGIADSGVETFNGTPIKSLAREICQNSIDAHQSNDRPTRIEFRTFEIAPTSIPDFAELKYALVQSQEFWSGQTNNKAKVFFKNALSLIKRPTITCMRISDYNTTGLTGSKGVYDTPWCNLIKSSGASDKSGSNGGSFGIGKYAPYACSALRTIFYSTSDKEGVCAYQGVSRLTSFRNKKGEITQGIGFYGGEKNSPVFQLMSLDSEYSRKPTEHGTDIFILGFSAEEDWKNEMIAAILDGFLYAVYNEKLIVDVEGVEVSKETLPSLMVTHKTYFKEHADEYYQALVDEKCSRTFVKELVEDSELKGKLTLRMLIMPEFHRRVAMVRQTGMKIKDKGNISGLIPFAGILYIEGDALNGYLRSIENPQHLEWEIERVQDKRKARNLLNSLTRFLKDCLEEMKNDDSEDALDPSVGEYLSAKEEDNLSNKEKVEDLRDSIKNIKVKIATVHTSSAWMPKNGDGKVEVDDEDGEIAGMNSPEEGGGHNGGSGSNGTGGGIGPCDGPGMGDNPVEHKTSLAAIVPAKMRILCRNKGAGEYTIVFMPATSADGGILELYMSAETQIYSAEIINASCDDCPELVVSENKIMNLTFVENRPLTIRVKLNYHDYCSMEVRAYGNKG